MFCLKASTDPGWAEQALLSLDAVLVDHAHCEMKAASNAMSLASRNLGDLELVSALMEIAREEIDHFQRVVEMLKRRGLSLGKPEVDDYAAKLRHAATGRMDPNISPLTDRLLVGALIEARSCERFKVLLVGLKSRDPELFDFYEELFTVEARHYQTMVDLAITASGGDRKRTLERLERLSEREAEIVRGLAQTASRATVHG